MLKLFNTYHFKVYYRNSLFMTDRKYKIVIGSRKSPLARKQVEIFKSSFSERFLFDEKIKFQSKFLTTSGDKFLNQRFSKIGNKGLFTKEIDEAQIAGDIDLSIHSLKDLPFRLPKGLKIGAYLKREDYRDAFISRNNTTLFQLKKNAIIGTSSTRREAQLKKIRSDFQFKIIRGNVESRIKKVKAGKYDATLLAMAGLKRLNIRDVFHPLSLNNFIPAVGQGIIVVVIRDNDQKNQVILNSISNKKTEIEANCERSFLGALEGSCEMPLGALAIKKKIKGSENITFRYFISKNNFTFCKVEKYNFSVGESLKKCSELGRQLKKLYF